MLTAEWGDRQGEYRLVCLYAYSVNRDCDLERISKTKDWMFFPHESIYEASQLLVAWAHLLFFSVFM